MVYEYIRVGEAVGLGDSDSRISTAHAFERLDIPMYLCMYFTYIGTNMYVCIAR